MNIATEKTQINEALGAALAMANGKRRERIASREDMWLLIREAAKMPSGQGLRATFGTVANSYKYKAPATQIAIARVGESLRVRIWEGRAAKVAYGGSDYVKSVRNRDVTALLGSGQGAIVIDLV